VNDHLEDYELSTLGCDEELAELAKYKNQYEEDIKFVSILFFLIGKQIYF